MAQFQSYSGGPHGLSAIQLPERPGILGEIGQAMGAIGQVPAQMQQAQLKNALTSLLIKSLTLPQTVETTQPGAITGFQPGSEPSVIDGSGFDFYNNPAPYDNSYGDIFTRTPDKKVTKANPEYTNVMDRLKQVGPAFGFNFNRGGRSTDDLLALEMARQSGRKELEALKGDERRETNKELYGGENKSTLQAKRLEAQTANKEKEIKQREAHDATIKQIAAEKNINDQVKTDKILKERDKYHSDQIANRKEWNGIFRKSVESQAELRESQQQDKITDDLIKLRTQINKLSQQDKSDPSVQSQMEGAIQQYNQLVEQANQNPDAPKVDKWELQPEEGIKNWLRSMGVPGMGSPTQRIVPSGGETPEQRRNRLLKKK